MINNKIKGDIFTPVLYWGLFGAVILNLVISYNQYFSYYETFIRNCDKDVINILTIITGGIDKSNFHYYLVLLIILYAINIYYNKKGLPKSLTETIYTICLITGINLLITLIGKINIVIAIMLMFPYAFIVFKTANIKIHSKLFKYLIRPFLTCILLFRFIFILMFMFNDTSIYSKDEKVKAVVIRKGSMHKGRSEVDIDALMNDTIINTEYDVHKINFVNIGDTIQVQRKKGKLGYYVYSSIINVYQR